MEVGATVAGRYRLDRLLGRGAMGEVWLATHMTLGEHVAIKFLRQESGGEDAEKSLSRFLFEAQVAARLSRKSRHIVRVTDHGEEGGVPYLVMERLEGESLEDRFQRGAVPLTTLQTIVSQCARGLALAHDEGVFHRDLKPANVFLTTDEEGRMVVKLLDFGIARAIRGDAKRSPTSTARGVVLGTPSYMSPEQARGLPHLDHRCDVWALGVVAYEGLTGTIPFEGETAEDVFVAVCTNDVVPIGDRRRGLGPEIHALFERALAERITDRFQTADELASEFAALSGVPDGPMPSSVDRGPRTDEVATQGKLAVSMSPTPIARSRVGVVAGLAVGLVVVAIGAKLALSPRPLNGGAPMPSTELPRASGGASNAEVQPVAVPTVAIAPDPIPTVAASGPPIAPPPRSGVPRPGGGGTTSPVAVPIPTASTIAPLPLPPPPPRPPAPAPVPTPGKTGNQSEVF